MTKLLKKFAQGTNITVAKILRISRNHSEMLNITLEDDSEGYIPSYEILRLSKEKSNKGSIAKIEVMINEEKRLINLIEIRSICD